MSETVSVGFGEVLDKVAASSDWTRKRAEYAKESGPVRRGIGLAVDRPQPRATSKPTAKSKSAAKLG